VDVAPLWGSQKKQERADALRLLDPRTAPTGPVVVVGTPKTGSLGLNLTAAHTVIYMSNDYSLMTRKQSGDRVHRPGQRHVVSYFDVVATGPQGQKTIDHTILKALQTKQDLASWTTAAWLAELRELPF
jgi:SNF2 family DNA or RNA helicase